MGDNTYIGGALNFTAKSIAGREGRPLPGFFGNIMGSMALLPPLFGLVAHLFFTKADRLAMRQAQCDDWPGWRVT
jgi:Na+/H+ antiporter NhaD/arsenite permease-like protein